MFNEVEHFIKEMFENIDKIRQNRATSSSDSFPELWYSMHSAQRPSSHSRHQTFDDLEIWRLSHIPQRDAVVRVEN
jgi:hypothetical protein